VKNIVEMGRIIIFIGRDAACLPNIAPSVAGFTGLKTA